MLCSGAIDCHHFSSLKIRKMTLHDQFSFLNYCFFSPACAHRRQRKVISIFEMNVGKTSIQIVVAAQIVVAEVGTEGVAQHVVLRM